MHVRYSRKRCGISLIYATAMMVALTGFISFGVDLGRVQVCKAELQRAADAAARYGAQALPDGSSAAKDNAQAAASENLVDGTALSLSRSNDIHTGNWNATTRTFTAGGTPRNAIRITAKRTGNNGIPLLFGKIVGVPRCDITATAIGLYTDEVQIDLPVNASSNPWLSGMPDGTLANPIPSRSGVRRDRAGAYTDPNGVFRPTGESPAQLTGINLIPGQPLTFDAIAGTGQHGPTQIVVGPDGNPNSIHDNDAGAEHGKSNLTAPIDAVVAVFLDDTNPSMTSPPPSLNFTTPTSRDFTSLSPQLKQVFFVGDGRTSTGAVQQFVVPPGATRLFIGKMDGYEWNNNSGQSTVTVHRPATVSLVK
jgi:hypothetical protein